MSCNTFCFANASFVFLSTTCYLFPLFFSCQSPFPKKGIFTNDSKIFIHPFSYRFPRKNYIPTYIYLSVFHTVCTVFFHSYQIICSLHLSKKNSKWEKFSRDLRLKFPKLQLRPPFNLRIERKIIIHRGERY